MARYAVVGDNVHVSDYEFCDQYGATFTNVLHIWRQSNIVEGRACQVCRSGGGSGMTIYYREQTPLSEVYRTDPRSGGQPVPVSELVAFMRQSGRLLVHCAGGICRSATLAVLARIARGARPFEAIAGVQEAIWNAYGEFPQLIPSAMTDIIRWAESEHLRRCLAQ